MVNKKMLSKFIVESIAVGSLMFAPTIYLIGDVPMMQTSVVHAESAFDRGNRYFDSGKYKEAIAEYNKAIRSNPNYFEAYYNRGLAYHLMENYTAAIDDYTKAIQINPQYADAYNKRGVCCQDIGNNARAQADFVKARALGYNE